MKTGNRLGFRNYGVRFGRQYDSWWFGVAWAGEDFVATAIEATSSFVEAAVTMLGELERGLETRKYCTLSARHLSAPLRRILTVAAAIPIGYVTTYGKIAAAAGSQARAGRGADGVSNRMGDH